MANMKQIAKDAGVSLGTVSHVMNGSAKVSEALRARVLQAIEKSGYQPNQLARGLRRDKTNMIAMIIPDIANPFFPGVVRGAEDTAFSNGYRLVLCNTDNNHQKELAHLSSLRTYVPSGLIIIPSSFSDLSTQADSYINAGTAVVCIDRAPRNWRGDSVTIDNVAGAHQAISFLLQLGHKRLAAITGPLHLSSANDRLLGFTNAMRAAKLSISPGMVQETTFDQAGGYTKTKILLRMLPRPTAIFACSDVIALGALKAIREENLRCPEDISLVGFDGLDVTEITHPSITSVYQSPYQLGATAMSLVLDRLSDLKRPGRHVVLDTELRIRESVAPPSSIAQKTPKKPTK